MTMNMVEEDLILSLYMYKSYGIICIEVLCLISPLFIVSVYEHHLKEYNKNELI